MIRQKVFGTVVLLLAGLVLIGGQPASSMGGAYGKGDPEHPIWKPQWSAGLKELVNREDRVAGQYVNTYDWFYFAGDTSSLNAFLEKYSKLADTPLTLVLHAGKATTPDITSVRTTPDFDWQLSIANQRPEDSKMTPATPYTVTLHLWLSGQVSLEGLKTPDNIEVRSGGEIESFVAHHQAKVGNPEEQ